LSIFILLVDMLSVVMASVAILLVIMLGVIALSIIILFVVMLNVVMMSVKVPTETYAVDDSFALHSGLYYKT
jgi:hypothetical protein